MTNENPHGLIVLGAGPIGLETALYARYLGYEVKVFERGESVAANLRQWGHVQLFSPFGMNATPLGVAALRAQDPAWQCPRAEAALSGAEFLAQYLLPLSQTDLLADRILLAAEVLAVGRRGWLKSEGIGDPLRGQAPLELLVKRPNGTEQRYLADVVIDCTGTYGNHNWLGAGGMPAVGERATEPHVEYGLPDVLGTERRRYADRHTLVVGAGYSAATVVVQLAELAKTHSHTYITWWTRNSHGDNNNCPIRRFPNDKLTNRDELAVRANALAGDSNSPVTHLSGQSIGAITHDQTASRFEVVFENDDSSTEQTKPFSCDRIVANVGYRPDNRIYSELQVHECYATGGPMKLAAQLLSQTSGSDLQLDCLDRSSYGPQSLLTPEPHFYILGSKSFGRRSHFLLSLGFNQIRDLFTLIGDREDLDLYTTMPQLASSE